MIHLEPVKVRLKAQCCLVSWCEKNKVLYWFETPSTTNIELYIGRYHDGDRDDEDRTYNKSPGCQTLHQGSQYTLFSLWGIPQPWLCYSSLPPSTEYGGPHYVQTKKKYVSNLCKN